MRINRYFILLFTIIVTNNLYSQKLGTIKNPMVLKFSELIEMPVLIENRFEITDTTLTNSKLAMATEYLINASVCVFESISNKDTNFIVEGREYLKLADTLYREFSNDNWELCHSKNTDMIMFNVIDQLEKIYSQLDNFTFPPSVIRYYKIDKRIFKVSDKCGIDILAQNVAMQESLFKMLRFEMQRLYDKK